MVCSQACSIVCTVHAQGDQGSVGRADFLDEVILLQYLAQRHVVLLHKHVDGAVMAHMHQHTSNRGA